MERNKSAKDIAFDRERQKLQSENFRLRKEIATRDVEISELKRNNNELDELVTSLKDVIESMSNLLGISSEALKKDMENRRALADLLRFLIGGGYH